MDAALPESAADEENCSWMTRWMSDKVSMLRANFPGESLNEIYKNLLSQRDLPGYIRSLDFVPEWVSCEYHTAYKNAGFIDKLHEMGIKVSLWTVDTEDSVRSLLRTSADAYITNRPDRVREWMERNRRQPPRQSLPPLLKQTPGQLPQSKPTGTDTKKR